MTQYSLIVVIEANRNELCMTKKKYDLVFSFSGSSKIMDIASHFMICKLRLTEVKDNLLGDRLKLWETYISKTPTLSHSEAEDSPISRVTFAPMSLSQDGSCAVSSTPAVMRCVV